MPSSPRDLIAHSQLDEDIREMLLTVYDDITRNYVLKNNEQAVVLAERMLAIAESGERDRAAIEARAAAGLPSRD
jgi:hypothetical protein